MNAQTPYGHTLRHPAGGERRRPAATIRGRIGEEGQHHLLDQLELLTELRFLLLVVRRFVLGLGLGNRGVTGRRGELGQQVKDGRVAAAVRLIERRALERIARVNVCTSSHQCLQTTRSAEERESERETETNLDHINVTHEARPVEGGVAFGIGVGRARAGGQEARDNVRVAIGAGVLQS